MRIISGKHRGRSIMLPKDGKIGGKTIRPTSDFAREGIFNILTHGKFNGGENLLPDARVLDVCAGTGAFGLEAISRGAANATFIEKERDIAELIRNNIERFGEVANCRILQTDATQLPIANTAFNLVFVDPPYSLGIVPAILLALHSQNWMENSTIVVVEHDERDTIPYTEYFALRDSRRYGRAVVDFLVYTKS
jgi:16S rRNA (guanine966-N2)-methyltransferase